LVGEGLDADQLLAAGDLTLDDPIEGAAADELVAALGHHAGRVEMAAALAHALLDPFLELGDRLDPDAELDQMQRHGGLHAEAFGPRQAGFPDRRGRKVFPATTGKSGFSP